MTPFVGSDEDTYHHDDGTGVITPIAKAGLPPEMQANIESQLPQAPSAPPLADGAPGPITTPLPGIAPGSMEPSAPKVTAEAESAANQVPGAVDPSQLATAGSGTPSAAPQASRVGQVEGGFKQEQAGIEKAAEAGSQLATAHAAYADQFAKEQERIKAETQAREAEREHQVSDQMAKVNQAMDEAKSAKIDPNHYWADKSTGDKVMAGIGILLGGISSGMTGKDNPAMAIIKANIDRDLEAQKANLNQKNQAASNQGTMLSMMRERFHDSRMAETAARAMGFEVYKLKLEQAAAQSENPMIKANAQKALGALGIEQGKEMMNLEVMARQQAALNQMQNGGQGINVEYLPKEARERVVVLPGGKQALAADPTTAQKVREAAASDEAFRKDLAALKEFAKEHTGTAVWDRQTINKGKAMAAALQNSYRNTEGMGVYKESEAQFMKNLIGEDPTQWFTNSTYIPQLDALGESASHKADAFYRTHIQGYKPIQFKAGK